MQLAVGESYDKDLLLLGLHFHERLRRQLFRKQAEQERQALLVHVFEDRGDVRGVHGDEDILDRRIFLFLQQRLEGALKR